MPFGPTDLFWTGIMPCAAAAIAMFLGTRLLVRPTAAWSLAIACGLIVGMVTQNMRVGWPIAFDKLLHPRVAIDWLPWLVLVAALISALAAYAPRAWRRWLVALACVFAIAIPLRLLASNAAAMSRWSLTEKLAILAFWSAVLAAGWLTLALGRQNRQPLLRSGLLIVVALGIALTIAASGALTLGELGGVAAATLLGAAGSARALRQLADGPSHAAGPLTVMFGGLILLGYSYELSATNAALLAISLAAAAGWLPFRLPLPLGKGRSEGAAGTDWREDVFRATLALVPLAIAVASAVAAATADRYG
jgi:hypothetical protein